MPLHVIESDKNKPGHVHAEVCLCACARVCVCMLNLCFSQLPFFLVFIEKDEDL